MAKVWLITGASRGFGRVWAEAALERGDSVAATARDHRHARGARRADTESACCALELDVTDKAAIDRSVRGRPRALRAPRRGRQQRRLRPVRGDRGGHRGGSPPADRDQPVRAAVGDQSGDPDPARAALGAHPAGVLDRRRAGVPDPRPLPRLQVGAGGLQPVALAKSWRSSASRSRSSSRAATGPTGRAHRPGAAPSCRSTTASVNGASGDSGPCAPSPATRRRRAPRCWSSSTRGAAAARVLRQQRPRDGAPRVRGAPRELGALERVSRCAPRARRRSPERGGPDRAVRSPRACLTARTGSASSCWTGRPGTGAGKVRIRLPSSTRAL